MGRTGWPKTADRPTTHPARLRCSSLEYSRYSRSSRLAGRSRLSERCSASRSATGSNPRRSRCSRDFCHGLGACAVERFAPCRICRSSDTSTSPGIKRDKCTAKRRQRRPVRPTFGSEALLRKVLERAVWLDFEYKGENSFPVFGHRPHRTCADRYLCSTQA